MRRIKTRLLRIIYYWRHRRLVADNETLTNEIRELRKRLGKPHD